MDYESLAGKIDKGFSMYRDDDHVYFLIEKEGKVNSIVMQEQGENLIVWAIEYFGKGLQDILRIFRDNVKQGVIIPYVESRTVCEIITSLGGKKIDFVDENEADYCQEFGTFLLQKI